MRALPPLGVEANSGVLALGFRPHALGVLSQLAYAKDGGDDGAIVPDRADLGDAGQGCTCLLWLAAGNWMYCDLRRL